MSTVAKKYLQESYNMMATSRRVHYAVTIDNVEITLLFDTIDEFEYQV